jgi:hypothetical protein
MRAITSRAAVERERMRLTLANKALIHEAQLQKITDHVNRRELKKAAELEARKVRRAHSVCYTCRSAVVASIDRPLLSCLALDTRRVHRQRHATECTRAG